MAESRTSEITQILHSWNSGDTAAKELLLPFVYEQLKKTGTNSDGEGTLRSYVTTDRTCSRSIYPSERSFGNRMEKPQSFLRHRVAPDAADFDLAKL